MNKELISTKQALAIFFVFVDGTLIFPTAPEARKDAWLSIILATLLALAISRIYIKLYSLYPGCDLFDIIHNVFGKLVGSVINIFFVWFAFHLASLVLNDFATFISTFTFPEISPIIPMIATGILVIWGLKSGIETLGRFCELIVFPVTLMAVATMFMLIPKMEPEHLRPVLEFGMLPVLDGALSAFGFPFGETVIFTMIFSCIKDKESVSKMYTWGLILGAIILILSKNTEIMVLGIERFLQFYFPAYESVGRMKIGEFIQRAEILVGLIFSFGGIIKMTICMLAANKGLAKVMGLKNYRVIAVPTVILLIDLALIDQRNIIELTQFTAKTWKYYAVPFELLFPAIVLLFAIIVKVLKRNANAQAN